VVLVCLQSVSGFAVCLNSPKVPSQIKKNLGRKISKLKLEGGSIFGTVHFTDKLGTKRLENQFRRATKNFKKSGWKAWYAKKMKNGLPRYGPLVVRKNEVLGIGRTVLGQSMFFRKNQNII